MLLFGGYFWDFLSNRPTNKYSDVQTYSFCNLVLPLVSIRCCNQTNVRWQRHFFHIKIQKCRIIPNLLNSYLEKNFWLNEWKPIFWFYSGIKPNIMSLCKNVYFSNLPQGTVWWRNGVKRSAVIYKFYCHWITSKIPLVFHLAWKTSSVLSLSNDPGKKRMFRV